MCDRAYLIHDISAAKAVAGFIVMLSCAYRIIAILSYPIPSCLILSYPILSRVPEFYFFSFFADGRSGVNV